MERLQKAAPKAHFVKAFSSVGAALMVNPEPRAGQAVDVHLRQRRAPRRREARTILETVRLGDGGHGQRATAARAIEPLCMLWCIPGSPKNDWLHAFKMLRK